jgi:crotonobetainyl-CoA:carnitine CoA-transferase CaiB-like acyl-CoA transferase
MDRWENGFTKFFIKHSKAELHNEAVKRGIMLYPLNKPDDLLNEEQLCRREFWAHVEHPELEENITYPGAPFKLSQTPWHITGRAPLIGEHNDEIYRKELGLSNTDLRLLKEQGVI